MVGKLGAVLAVVASVAIALFVWRLDSAADGDHSSPDGSVYVLGGVACVLTAFAICYIVQSERVFQLAYFGAGLLFLGAVLGLVGVTVVQPAQPGVASDLTVAGSTIMLFGGTMWAYTNFILGPTE